MCNRVRTALVVVPVAARTVAGHRRCGGEGHEESQKGSGEDEELHGVVDVCRSLFMFLRSCWRYERRSWNGLGDLSNLIDEGGQHRNRLPLCERSYTAEMAQCRLDGDR